MNAIAFDRKTRIERCIRQARRYYALESELPFEQDFIKQDAIAMNLQRAAELTIRYRQPSDQDAQTGLASG